MSQLPETLRGDAPSAAPNGGTSSGHIPALDGLRGLAILLVTLYRFSTGPTDPSAAGQWLFPVLHLGWCGVDLFFVLSGFLITGILFDSKDKDGYLVNFFGRRALRIFPLYYGVLLVSFLLLPWVGVRVFAPQEPQQAWLWLYGTNIYQAVQGAWCLGPFNHFWSLAVEEHFYLVWPFVIGYFSRTTAMRICVGLVVASVVGRTIWMLVSGNEIAPSVLTLFRADALAVGAWLALATRDRRGVATLVSGAWVTAILTGLALIPLLALHRRFLMIPEALLAWFFGAVLVIAVADRGESRLGWLWNIRFLQVLGKYSYGMYVFQNLLIPLVAPVLTSQLLCDRLESVFWGRLCYLGIMSTLTFALAVASWHLFEQHFLKLKDFLFTNSIAQPMEEGMWANRSIEENTEETERWAESDSLSPAWVNPIPSDQSSALQLTDAVAAR